MLKISLFIRDTQLKSLKSNHNNNGNNKILKISNLDQYLYMECCFFEKGITKWHHRKSHGVVYIFIQNVFN